MGNTIVRLYQKQNFVIGEDILKAIKDEMNKPNNTTNKSSQRIRIFHSVQLHKQFHNNDNKEESN